MSVGKNVSHSIKKIPCVCSRLRLKLETVRLNLEDIQFSVVYLNLKDYSTKKSNKSILNVSQKLAKNLIEIG